MEQILRTTTSMWEDVLAATHDVFWHLDNLEHTCVSLVEFDFDKLPATHLSSSQEASIINLRKLKCLCLSATGV